MSFQDLFIKYASNSQISIDKLLDILNFMNVNNANIQTVKQLVQLICHSSQSDLGYEEFARVVYILQKCEKDAQKAVFLSADTEQKGYLSPSELHQLMCSLGLVSPYQQILKLKISQNISYEDFCLILKEMSEK
ncbi:EF-hand_domain pair-containing protein [Hexamita inflata]|uniref:EF-hand domain pair-containing protein n=1 Tax=Hexamita inflata TaxID=28002 RepID=A0AA86TP53_9EUKA|nr:EF-hand domain pair-containing protein [Hexamita inflata]